eukprot:GHVU01090304.1.p1 GENE.GHVU01090304.1~~GHVU01090304.1.p1  ORF type:complete len:124 (-),score=8.59 GHVU01090304.1:750-1121(-)
MCGDDYHLVKRVQCRSKGNAQLLTECPPGFVLNAAKLASSNYYNSPVMCIAKASVRTEYQCPDVRRCVCVCVCVCMCVSVCLSVCLSVYVCACTEYQRPAVGMCRRVFINVYVCTYSGSSAHW